MLEQHVAKIKGSMPSESSQPGYELVYITRSPTLFPVHFVAWCRANAVAQYMQCQAVNPQLPAQGNAILTVCLAVHPTPHDKSLYCMNSRPLLEQLQHCRHLAQNAGFKGNETDYYDVDNSCFNRVLERGTGIPITLGLLYILIAHRLGCAVHGLNLPAHFMLGNNIEGISNLLVDPFDGALCSSSISNVQRLGSVEYYYINRPGTNLKLS